MRIGIFGGTFDPIHFAHIHDISYACDKAALDVCYVVVAGEPWQKPEVDVSADQRYKWVQMSVGEYFPEKFYMFEEKKVDIIVDDREIKREGKTYTIDTLQSFKEEFPNDDLILIVGDDVPKQMTTWKEYENILEMVEMFEVPRAIMPISSTYIREEIAAGRTVRGLLPIDVESDIFELDYYQKNT